MIHKSSFIAMEESVEYRIHCFETLEEGYFDRKSDDLKTSVAIAVKKAKCQKLTKAEKKILWKYNDGGFTFFSSRIWCPNGIN